MISGMYHMCYKYHLRLKLSIYISYVNLITFGNISEKFMLKKGTFFPLIDAF